MSLPSQAADGDLDGYAFDATGPLGSGYFPATRSEARTKQSSCYRADRAALSSVPSRRRFDGVVIAHTGLPRYYRITGESEPDFVPVDHDEGDVDGCRLPPRSTAAREPLRASSGRRWATNGAAVAGHSGGRSGFSCTALRTDDNRQL